MHVPSRLRAARIAAGLSQTHLATLTGVGRVSISRYESGSVMPAADVYLRLLSACQHPAVTDTLDEQDRALLDAQLARTPEARLHASHELSRLRAHTAARG
ncbi:MAG: helix-turn-helix domain-containing protein [Euzebya sp.]